MTCELLHRENLEAKRLEAEELRAEAGTSVECCKTPAVLRCFRLVFDWFLIGFLFAKGFLDTGTPKNPWFIEVECVLPFYPKK